MLELSLKDCNMENTNIYIKEYEKDCFESLFPGCSPSDTTISVFVSFYYYIVWKYWFSSLDPKEIPWYWILYDCWRRCI